MKHRTILPAFSPEQIRSINKLVGEALLSSSILHRLITMRDQSLALEFELTSETWSKLTGIEADNLQEFCLGIAQLQGELLEQRYPV